MRVALLLALLSVSSARLRGRSMNEEDVSEDNGENLEEMMKSEGSGGESAAADGEKDEKEEEKPLSEMTPKERKEHLQQKYVDIARHFLIKNEPPPPPAVHAPRPVAPPKTQDAFGYKPVELISSRLEEVIGPLPPPNFENHIPTYPGKPGLSHAVNDGLCQTIYGPTYLWDSLHLECKSYTWLEYEARQAELNTEVIPNMRYFLDRKGWERTNPTTAKLTTRQHDVYEAAQEGVVIGSSKVSGGDDE